MVSAFGLIRHRAYPGRQISSVSVLVILDVDYRDVWERRGIDKVYESCLIFANALSLIFIAQVVRLGLDCQHRYKEALGIWNDLDQAFLECQF